MFRINLNKNKMSCSSCSLSTISPESVMSYGKLSASNWLDELPDTTKDYPLVEVQFKNTRKDFFYNPEGFQIRRGDQVVVQSTLGHDLGRVLLTGKVAWLQFKRRSKLKHFSECKRIYRLANDYDLEKARSFRQRDYPVMIEARQIIQKLGLEMKLSDVEYQADGRKAIFYYIANGRVDFRELIKELSQAFHIRVEMKQIGARQEAGLVGGIGSCGRELCCSSWRTDFTSISTQAVSLQNLSPGAQKLAGQCGKLKCCLMFELENYIEAREDFPRELIELDMKAGRVLPLKIEVLARKVYYVYADNKSLPAFYLSLDEVKDVIQLNKRGITPAYPLDENPVSEFVSGKANIRNSKPKYKKNKRSRNPKLKSKSR